jgi:hypothetical protein
VLLQMRRSAAGRLVAVSAAATVLAMLAASGGAAYAEGSGREPERPEPIAGENAEVDGIKTFAMQEAVARLAPYGSVAPGEYSEALAQLGSVPTTAGRWSEVTDQPYNQDDPNYRDPVFSNSGSGWGTVAGRTTGLAAGNGYLFAGGANGGVFRKKLGRSGHWEPISDGILALSTGDLNYDAKSDTLWYATGEANTGGTSYTGAGVYRLRHATRVSGFTNADRVGGDELESRSINSSSSTAPAGSTRPPRGGCGGTPSLSRRTARHGSSCSCPIRPRTPTSPSRTTTSSTTS